MAEVVRDKTETYEKMINNHSERLDKPEREEVELKVEIKKIYVRILNH